MTKALYVPVSWGEAIDKLTILEIKSARLTDETALANVRLELSMLREITGAVAAGKPEIAALVAQLKAVNEKLWDIEDEIRAKESVKSFDAEFVALARAVYKNNDERGALKRQINLALSSTLIEEKSYKSY